MKSPAELSQRWIRQWQLADNRELRLLYPESWPVSLPIGKPSPREFTQHTDLVREHLHRWRAVRVGRVCWEPMSFRSGSEPVEVPVCWELHNPTEWVAACGDRTLQVEYERLNRLVAAVDPIFRRILVRQRHLLQEKSEEQIVKAAEVALALAPGCAAGRPLRALSVCGIDSKFFERHRALLIHFLDLRFGGQVCDLGLERFLNALDESEHWLLVAPLAPGLMPFVQQRLRAGELATTALPGSHLLIVENERCLHQLSTLADTVAVLGAGLNLEWMVTAWLRERKVAYWGDMDTWGFAMLAKARGFQPHVEPLLMTRELFDRFHSTLAVNEAAPAAEQTPETLTESEMDLYRYLRGLEKGRIEQEFLPRGTVEEALGYWRQRT